MTIAYLIDYDIQLNTGVMQKIKQQANQWKIQGHKIYFASSKTMSIYDENYDVQYKKKCLDFKYGRVSTALNLLYTSYYLNTLFEEIDFDIIYMRYRLYMPFIRKILKKNVVIMEINSDDKEEYKLHSHVTDIYNRMTRNFLLKEINAYVCVSNELAEKFSFLNKPIEVIANGIDIQRYKSIKKERNKVPKLVFIGTPNQPWHGLDKIKKMADYFSRYQFIIIGTDGMDTNNIKYMGYLSQEKAIETIAKCDIGIGTLSLYEKGLTEASPLKTRQYLACGLPIIYAYKDTDLQDDVKFGLQLKNSKNNIDYEKIETFVTEVFNDEEIQNMALKFTENILNYKKKESKRIKFFQKVLDAV